jgi:hypothetical protein
MWRICRCKDWPLPAISRSSRDAQYFFVNGRFVPTRSRAALRGYQDIMHHQRHPAFVLFLDLPPEQVDVNVHPAKAVRFPRAGHPSVHLPYAATAQVRQLREPQRMKPRNQFVIPAQANQRFNQLDDRTSKLAPGLVFQPAGMTAPHFQQQNMCGLQNEAAYRLWEMQLG